MGQPNFLIIGAQKAGTTFLWDLLRAQDAFYLPDEVELRFFQDRRKINEAGFDAYKSKFHDRPDGAKWIGEKTPSYFWSTNGPYGSRGQPGHWNEDIPGSVKSYLGDQTRIILTLRDPVTRAISAFYHHYRRGRIKDNESIVTAGRRHGIIDMGFYGAHLRAWRRHFPASQILVLTYEDDIRGGAASAVRKLSSFFGHTVASPSSSSKDARNVGASLEIREERIGVSGEPDSPTVSDGDIQELRQIFADDIWRLQSDNDLQVDHAWDAQTISDIVRGRPKGDERKLGVFSGKRPVIGRVANAIKRSQQVDGQPVKADLAGTTNASEGPPVAARIRIQPQGLSSVSARSSGVDSTRSRGPGLPKRYCLETPVRLSKVELMHSVGIGAFSYFVDGRLYWVDIGRYCSVARGVHIGQTGHPGDWLSTHPFQYSAGFTFDVGNDFEGAAELAAHQVDTSLPKPVKAAKTRIGHDVWLGNSVYVGNGIDIGNGAMVGARSVVTADVPAYAIVAGVPARVIRKRFDDDTISRFQRVQWWQYAPWQLVDIPFNRALDALDILESPEFRRATQPFAASVVASDQDRVHQFAEVVGSLEWLSKSGPPQG